jgi:hypothetical protein
MCDFDQNNYAYDNFAMPLMPAGMGHNGSKTEKVTPDGKIIFTSTTRNNILQGTTTVINTYTFKDQATLDTLREHLVDDSLWQTATLDLTVAMQNLQAVKRIANPTANLQAFIGHVEVRRRPIWTNIKAQLAKGVIAYDSLWAIFERDAIAIGERGKYEFAGRVHSTAYTNRYYTISVECTVPFMGGFTKIRDTMMIPEYSGVRPISELSVRRLVDNDERSRLQTEGRRLADIMNQKQVHVMYDGHMNTIGQCGYVPYPVKGRIMIDPSETIRRNNQYHRLMTSYPDDTTATELTDDAATIVYPFLLGCNHSGDKIWGEFHIGRISQIVYNNDALDELVIAQERKDVLCAILKNRDRIPRDIIGNKGMGTIILLAGHPGVGKTLTAEAIAETLHLPVYYLSAADLGIEVSSIDSNLKRTLELCSRWNAVLLLDEADVYVTQRDETDLHRNSVVSTFLKRLEYHDGIVFLTSNRIETIDSAIMSRIHVTLHYPDLTPSVRRTIWCNILAKFKTSLDSDLLDRLQVLKLNGREIRNIICMAAAISSDKPTIDDIDRVMLIDHRDYTQKIVAPVKTEMSVTKNTVGVTTIDDGTASSNRKSRNIIEDAAFADEIEDEAAAELERLTRKNANSERKHRSGHSKRSSQHSEQRLSN